MKTEMYQQGSQSCHQYSAHTMQIRTQAVYLLLTYIGVMGLALRGAEPAARFPTYYGSLLVGAGIILLLAAVVLGILNHHYSSAHNAIRSALHCAILRTARDPGLLIGLSVRSNGRDRLHGMDRSYSSR